MSVLYRRLKAVGYDQAFLRSAVLPDWWDDALAENPVTLQQILVRLSRRLSLPFKALSSPDEPLNLVIPAGIRLKRAKAGTDRKDVAPGMMAARNTVALVLPELQGVPAFAPGLTAAALRESILAKGRLVELDTLIEACWTHGIAVFHFKPLPTAAKKFAGMAYFEGERPVIVLASGYDAPPRNAFYLAHEIGHILRGHVAPGGEMIADGDLTGPTEDLQEKEADQDAMVLLAGRPDPHFGTILGLTGEKLAKASLLLQKQDRIHAGTVALIYGKTADRMGAAMEALNLLNMNQGGRSLVAEALFRRLPSADEQSGDVREVLSVFGL